MAQATVGALRVVLGADTAQFEKAMRGVSKRMSRFGASLAQVGKVVAGSMATATAGFALAVRGQLKEADKWPKA